MAQYTEVESSIAEILDALGGASPARDRFTGTISASAPQGPSSPTGKPGDSYLARFGETLVKNGYAVIPILAGTKRPPGWMSHEKGDPWSAVTPDIARVRQWVADKRLDGAGVGVNLGGRLFALDIDVLDPDMAAEILEWIEWNLPGAPPQRIGLAPKTLLLFRTETAIRKIASTEYIDTAGRKAQVEGLGEGEQFVGYAIHPDTKKPYSWPGADLVDTPVDKLPLINVTQARALVAEFERLAAARGWTVKRRGSASLVPRGDVDDDEWTDDLEKAKTDLSTEELEKLLKAIPNDDMGGTVSFDDWLAAGMSLYHQTDGSDEGFKLWTDWSGQSSKHVQAECERRWSSFNISGKGREALTARWLIKQAGGLKREKVAKQIDDSEPTDVVGDVHAAEHVARDLRGNTVHIDGRGWFARQPRAASFSSIPKSAVQVHITRKIKQLHAAASEHVRSTNGSESAQRQCAALAGMLQREPRLRGVLNVLATLPNIAAQLDEFDREADLLATPAGVWILPQGHTREAEAADRHLRCTAVVPQAPPVDLERDAPHFAALLRFIADDNAEVIAFMQGWFGYSATGHAREHRALVLVGPGGNGKGTLLNLVHRLLGSYASVAASATFLGSASERHSEDVDALRGSRFVSVQEVPPGAKWSQQRLTMLISTDPITARGVYQARSTFIPSFCISFAMNTRPRLARVDAAIRRRLLILEATKVPAAPDPLLSEKLWSEGPAILRWIFDGAARWYREGLQIPAAIREASENYFQSEDVIPRFVAETCEEGPRFAVDNKSLHAAFLSWLVQEGRRDDAASIDLPLAIADIGFERIKDTGGIRGRGFRGLRLRQDGSW